MTFLSVRWFCPSFIDKMGGSVLIIVCGCSESVFINLDLLWRKKKKKGESKHPSFLHLGLVVHLREKLEYPKDRTHINSTFVFT